MALPYLDKQWNIWFLFRKMDCCCRKEDLVVEKKRKSLNRYPLPPTEALNICF